MSYSTDVLSKIRNRELLIFGAGLMGRSLLKCLLESDLNCTIKSFLVTSNEGNPTNINGIKVIIAEDYPDREDTVLVALHENKLLEAMNMLKKTGYSNLIPVSFDSDEWCDIRLNWILKNNTEFDFGIKYEEEAVQPEQKFEVTTYVAKSIYDKQNENILYNKTEKFIQVGASLTDILTEKCRDNVGDNISEKNKKYCELTALYWIWKNDKTSDYKGLSHYRRRFNIADGELKKIGSGEYDFFVTVPIINFDTVEIQFKRDHKEIVWDVTRRVIQESYPEYEMDFEVVSKSIYYYGYNMFIARNEAFNEYCDWLFPILSECEKRVGDIDDAYQNRYIGFVAERLLTVFVNHNMRKYKVCIINKHFISNM